MAAASRGFRRGRVIFLQKAASARSEIDDRTIEGGNDVEVDSSEND